MPRFLPLTVACLCSLALTLPAIADDDLPNATEFFDEYDTNADGKVTSEEFRGAAEIYKLLDKNKDGVLTPSDLGLPADYKPDPNLKKRRAGAEAGARGGKQAERAKRAEEMRKKLIAMDVNEDGKVSRAEWKGPPEAFDRIDRNKDGVLDKADRPKGRGKPDRGMPGGKRAGGDKKPGAATDEQRMARVTAHFEKIDKNGDGKLTADESPNPKLIEVADANGDGGVTLEEFVGFMKTRQGAGRDGKKPDGDRKRGGRKMSSGMLRRWDRDADGKVSPDEFPGRDEAFARYDVDKDGFLTEADVKSAQGGSPAKKAPVTSTGDLIQDRDTDGDGRLNRSEFPGTNAEWRALDKDGDGYVTRAEAGK